MFALRLGGGRLNELMNDDRWCLCVAHDDFGRIWNWNEKNKYLTTVLERLNFLKIHLLIPNRHLSGNIFLLNVQNPKLRILYVFYMFSYYIFSTYKSRIFIIAVCNFRLYSYFRQNLIFIFMPKHTISYRNNV